MGKLISSPTEPASGLGPSGFDPSRMSVADVLDAAADLLSRPGAWTQEWYGKDDSGNYVYNAAYATCFCTLGAMNVAAGMRLTSDLGGAREFLEAYVGEVVPEWNDAPERTQEEVVAKLREAAQASRSQDTQKGGAE